MTNIIELAARRNSRKVIFAGNAAGSVAPAVDLEAAKAVASSVCLRPGPTETPAMFVTRIVREYELARGAGAPA